MLQSRQHAVRLRSSGMLSICGGMWEDAAVYPEHWLHQDSVSLIWSHRHMSATTLCRHNLAANRLNNNQKQDMERSYVPDVRSTCSCDWSVRVKSLEANPRT